jgi:hypothetical protein
MAFSSASLKVFEDKVITRTNDLVNALENVNTGIVDLGEWMGCVA